MDDPPWRQAESSGHGVVRGGAGVGGNSWIPPLGPALARKGVVLVSIEFRIGVLGHLAHPALTSESAHHASGNYGGCWIRSRRCTGFSEISPRLAASRKRHDLRMVRRREQSLRSDGFTFGAGLVSSRNNGERTMQRYSLPGTTENNSI